MSESPPPPGAWQPPSEPTPVSAPVPSPTYQPTTWGQPAYGGSAWQPPPQPGVVPLRPLGLGEMLDGAVRTMRQNPQVMFGLSAMIMAVAVVLSTVLLLVGLPQMVAGLESLESVDTGPTREQITSTVSGGLISFVLPAVIQYFALIVLTGVLILAVSDAVLGRRPSVGEVFGRARPRLLRLIGLTLLTGLLQILAFVACLVPGIGLLFVSGVAGGIALFLGVLLGVVVLVWLWVHFAFAAPALLLEELGIRAAIGRSWRLGARSWWRVLGILVLTAIIGALTNGLLSFPFSLIGGVVGALLTDGQDTATATVRGQAVATGITNIGTILATTVTAPFAAAVTALLYIDLRIRREGLDVALAKAAAQTPPADR
jgi:hypothetical protein